MNLFRLHHFLQPLLRTSIRSPSSFFLSPFESFIRPSGHLSRQNRKYYTVQRDARVNGVRSQDIFVLFNFWDRRGPQKNNERARHFVRNRQCSLLPSVLSFSRSGLDDKQGQALVSRKQIGFASHSHFSDCTIMHPFRTNEQA